MQLFESFEPFDAFDSFAFQSGALGLARFLQAGGAGRGIPARRAGATPVISALGAEDGWADPATGPGWRQFECADFGGVQSKPCWR
jgi:hypothetical protein